MMTSQVSEFLKDKWHQAFHFFDVNKDGFLTVEDYEKIADCISKETNASEEQARKTKEEWTKWPRLMMKTNPAAVKMDETVFVSTAQELYGNLENYKRQIRMLICDLFDRLDLNKNGVICQKEFELFYKAFGRTNMDDMAMCFSKIDKDGDGFIEREELIDDGVRFYSDPDPVTGQAYTFYCPQEKNIHN